MNGPPSLQARIDEQSRTGSYASYSDPSTGIEEADSVVETLLVMEHADRGSLNRFMVSTCMKSDMMTLLLCAMDIATGMSYLHSINLLHGDLKTANVLLKSCSPSEEDPRGFSCKIADFGLSRLVSEGATHVSTNSHGTIAYVAPEMLQTGAMGMLADVYSFAMLMLELWKGELVYRGVNTHQVLYQVFGGHKPEVPDDMPADYRALMEDCWATAPAARPTFPAILERLQPMLADARTATGPGAPHAP